MATHHGSETTREPQQQPQTHGAEMMYRLQVNDDWFNGMKFESFAAAKEKADQVADRGLTVDVIALTDRDTFRVAYTPANCRAGQSVRATFLK